MPGANTLSDYDLTSFDSRVSALERAKGLLLRKELFDRNAQVNVTVAADDDEFAFWVWQWDDYLYLNIFDYYSRKSSDLCTHLKHASRKGYEYESVELADGAHGLNTEALGDTVILCRGSAPDFDPVKVLCSPSARVRIKVPDCNAGLRALCALQGRGKASPGVLAMRALLVKHLPDELLALSM